MAMMRSLTLPDVPRGVDPALLASNHKLYSDELISLLKAQFTSNGRYREYVDNSGVTQKLPYPVYVFDDKCIAVIPGKRLKLADGDSVFAKCLLAQDLDSGVWIVDKKIKTYDQPDSQNSTQEDVAMEMHWLQHLQQFIRSGANRPLAVMRELTSPGKYNESTKYDLFINRARGMDLKDWMMTHPLTPDVIKLQITTSLIAELMRLHRNGVLHRDIKPRNAVFDYFNDHAMQLVDFGLSVGMDELNSDLLSDNGTPGFMAPEIRYVEECDVGQYSVKSDVYALGVTLAVLWGFGKVEGGVFINDFTRQAATTDALKGNLIQIIREMLDSNPASRPDLSDILNDVEDTFSLISPDQRVIRIGVLDVAAVKNISDMNLESSLRELTGNNKFHQIQLANTDVVDDLSRMMRVKFLLEKMGLMVADEVICSSPSVDMDMLKTRQLQLFKGAVQQVDYITVPQNRVVHTEGIQQVLPPVAMTEARQEAALITNETESYNWGDWFSWFCGDLPADTARASFAVRDAVCAPGCFGLFGSLRNSRDNTFTMTSRDDVDTNHFVM